MSYSLKQQLTAEEGVIPHVYQDHLGYWTIGIGRLVDRRKGGGLSNDEMQYLLSNDIIKCEQEVREALPWYDSLDEPRKAVLVGMCFQMGLSGLLRFQATLTHIKAGNYESAATSMKRSLWARQTPDRALRMAEQMRIGQWQKKPE